MAQKIRNKNQKATTAPADGLDKQDPLDLETLNSEPKGKGKSKKSRAQERLEREKLLQQHRQHQQETLKRQREREHVQKAPPTGEPIQHTQHEQPAPPTTKTPSDILNQNEQPGNDAHDPVPEPTAPVQGSLHPNDEGHGALGDSILRNAKPASQRCTNCCGRPQVCRNRCQEKFKPTEGARCRTGVELCLPDHVNGEDEGQEQKHEMCRCHSARKDRTHDVKTTSFHSCEVNEPGVWTPETPRVQEMQNSKDEDETRLRGGCGGGCGGGRAPACCPCGGCGGAACATNTGCGNRPPAGCCGGNQSRGLPCRCRCKSCSPCPPCGTCGGQNCGKWNSCAGSGGGKCCFPRNTRRHNGAQCCGGGGCGGCGGCC